MIFHHFPISTASGFFLGSYAAVAAAKQDYEWQFIELFFANQDQAKKHGATQDFLNNVARAIGVGNFNIEQWQNDMNDSDIEQTLKDDETLAAGPASPRRARGRRRRPERHATADRVALTRPGPGGDRAGELTRPEVFSLAGLGMRLRDR